MNNFPVRRLFLMLLILVSFLLTYAIFSQDLVFVPEDNTNTTTSPSQTISLENEANSVFGPSRIVKYEDDGIDVINPRLIEDEEAVQFFGGIDFRNLNYYGNLTISNVLELSNNEPTYVYAYDEPIVFGVLEQVFPDFPEEVANMSFDYVFFPIFSNTAYFYNSITMDMYSAETEGDLDSILENWVNEYQIPRIKSFETILGNKVYYLPNEQLALSYKDYLLDALPNSLFVEMLFDNPSNVNVNNTTRDVVYNDYYAELRINQTTNSAVYTHQQYSENSQALLDLIERSYSVLNQTETWTNGVYLSDVDIEEQTVFFRRYLDGYPVFAQNNEDGIELEFSGTTLTNLSFNKSIVQTPINSTQEDYVKNMTAGQDVLNMIMAEVENPNLIENIRIGYEWTYHEDTSRVAHFVPYWFYRYNGTWHKLEEGSTDEQ